MILKHTVKKPPQAVEYQICSAAVKWYLILPAAAGWISKRIHPARCPRE